MPAAHESKISGRGVYKLQYGKMVYYRLSNSNAEDAQAYLSRELKVSIKDILILDGGKKQ